MWQVWQNVAFVSRVSSSVPERPRARNRDQLVAAIAKSVDELTGEG